MHREIEKAETLEVDQVGWCPPRGVPRPVFAC